MWNGIGAPVIAIHASASSRRVGPSRVISSPQASGGLPHKALAIRSAGSSNAPARPTPRCAYPLRPASCRVVSSPGLRTSIATRMPGDYFEFIDADRAKAEAVAGGKQAGRLALRIEQGQRRAPDQLPPAWKLVRIDARLCTTDRDRARGDAGARVPAA